MDRRRFAAAGLLALGVVIIALAGGWFLFFDTPAITESDLNATTPDPTVAAAPPEFTMTVDVRSDSNADGSEQANWSAGTTYDADSRERLGWLSVTEPNRTLSITHYQRYSDNVTHNHIRYHNSDAEQFARRVESIRTDLDNETESLHVENASRTYEYYRRGDRGEFEVVPDLIPPLGFIQTIPFERRGSTTYRGKAVDRYVPVSGWTEADGSIADDGPDWYVSNPSGELYVSEESGNIVYVNVSVTSKRTDVRAGRWFGDAGNRARITLAVREETDREELQPAWVDEKEEDA